MLPADPRLLGALVHDVSPAVALTVVLPVLAATLLAVTLVVRRTKVNEHKRPRVAMRRVEDRELCALVTRLETDNRQFQRLLKVLPDFTRRLGADVDRRTMAPLLINFFDYLFAPERMILLLESAHEDGFVPVGGKGLDAPLRREVVVRPGDGRIGWVALHKMSMSGQDFRARGVRAAGADPTVRSLEREISLCVPMVHDGEVRGVIALAGIARTAFDARPVARMIADLGAIALDNATLIRRSELAANQDELTGLYNRRFLQTALDAELTRSRSTGEPLSVFFFDVDHFKAYNDENGHQAGDEALATIGRLTAAALRDGDVPARYGGEEFVAILPGADADGALDAAAKIRRAILDHPFRCGRRQPGGRVTISGGVATWPHDGGTADELLRAADAALYRAKRAGRDRIEAAREAGETAPRFGAAEA